MSNVFDNFSRTGSLVGSTTSDTTKTWAQFGTYNPTLNGTYCPSTGSGITTGVAYVDAGTADLNLQWTLPTTPGAFERSTAAFRITDGSNLWLAEVRQGSSSSSGSYSATIYKLVAGSSTTVVSNTSLSGNPASGDTITVNIVADRIKLSRNGTLVLDTGTGQTFNQSATKHGLGSNFSIVGNDDFTITDLSVTTWATMTFKVR